MALARSPHADRPNRANRWNAEYIEALYEDWKRDPGSLSENWQMFFEGFELAMCPRTCVAAENARLQSQVNSLIYAYRSLGHSVARVNPLADGPATNPQLALAPFGLDEGDLDRVFDTGHMQGVPRRATLRDVIAALEETYCRSVGVEYIHIQDVAIRRWLQQQMEPIRNRPTFSRAVKMDVLERLTDAELFEKFIHTRYPGQKRFSLEGAETLIPAIHALVELAPDIGVEEIVVGMAHRGRLNVLANILDKSYEMLFSEFQGNFLPGSVAGDGDVKYHKGFSSDHPNARGGVVRVSLTANPSHLEAVDPVVEGRARAKQRQLGDTADRGKVLPLLVHGDAAFSGQGIVAETLNLSKLPGYRTGGTVHIIVNNQIGFTTSPEESRSSSYATDVAKMIEAPIFHVNGDDPEATVYATELALRFRQAFGRDVVVDMVCYRRHGHNEADEPAFTQPVLYRKIKDRPSVRGLYLDTLVAEGALSCDAAESMAQQFRDRLQRAFETVRGKDKAPVDVPSSFAEYWDGLSKPYSHAPVPTGVSHETLVEVARGLTTVPDGFLLNPKVRRYLPERLESVEKRGTVDWAFAEALAFGSLLVEGTPVRLSGQDSARGTFSQRHSVWQDMETQDHHTPLNHLRDGQERYCVYNSSLSEAAVLGFEYGYSLVEPRMLILWEAQFGDFANGAQVIIDQFITSSLAKWDRSTGLVMLLPHGYEGQGPEHSNAYLERYLQACAEDNIQVVNLSTPAQYFHALRRQVRRDFRRPLVVMAPKSLLRHPHALSPVDELVDGRFHEVLDDPEPPERVRRVVLTGGKVFHDIADRRKRDAAAGSAAIVRIEQFYPFPEAQLRQVLGRYRDAETVVWAQEESRNRGAWTFLAERLPALLDGRPLRYAGRAASASPATGSRRVHQREQDALVLDALVGDP